MYGQEMITCFFFQKKNIQVEFICSNQFKLLTKYFRNAISLTWLKVHAYVTIDVYLNHLKFKSLFFFGDKKKFIYLKYINDKLAS